MSAIQASLRKRKRPPSNIIQKPGKVPLPTTRSRRSSPLFPLHGPKLPWVAHTEYSGQEVQF